MAAKESAPNKTIDNNSDELAPMSALELANVLLNTCKRGHQDYKLVIAGDEEGNSFSSVCMRGLKLDLREHRVYIYPLSKRLQP